MHAFRLNAHPGAWYCQGPGAAYYSDMWLRATAVVLVLTIGLAVASCRGDDPAPVPTALATSTPAPGETAPPQRSSTAAVESPTATPAAWPPATRVGDPTIDAVIDAVLLGDTARLYSFYALADVPCEPQQPFEPPPNVPVCGGDPVGTPHSAFPVLSCEVNWAFADAILADWPRERAPALYAAYRRAAVSPEPPALPRGDVAVVFEWTELTHPAGSGVTLELREGRVVLMDFGCGPFDRVLEGVPRGAFLLEPPGGVPSPSPTPVPRVSGDSEIDALVSVLIDGDWARLPDLWVRVPTPCATNPQGVGAPPLCPQGGSDGDLVDVARLSACEGTYLLEDDDFERIFRSYSAFPRELYAVYRSQVESHFDGFLPAGEYTIVLRDVYGDSAQAWHVAGGRFTGAQLGCGHTLADFIEDIPEDAFLVPPAE